MADQATPPPEQVAKAKEELKTQGTAGASALSVVTAAKTDTIAGFWAFVSTPVGWAAIGGILLGLRSMATEYISKMPSPDATQKVEIINWPKPVSAKKYVYQVDPSTDLSILKGLPPGNVEMNEIGSKYEFNKVAYPLPVQVTRVDGVDVEVKKLP